MPNRYKTDEAVAEAYLQQCIHKHTDLPLEAVVAFYPMSKIMDQLAEPLAELAAELDSVAEAAARATDSTPEYIGQDYAAIVAEDPDPREEELSPERQQAVECANSLLEAVFDAAADGQPKSRAQQIVDELAEAEAQGVA